jgi:8-oxo-dGTP pyrophosphatase MutT (NUDIX family)
MAGLIDANESDPVSSAQRELKEETGYSVPKDQFKILKLPIAYEPGLSNSCCYIAKVTIDITKLAEQPVQELEPDEWSLQTISLPLKGLLNKLIGKSYKLKESSCS